MQRLVELSHSIVVVEDYEMRANGTPRYVMVTRIGPTTMRSNSDYTVFDRPRSTVNSVLDSPFGTTPGPRPSDPGPWPCGDGVNIPANPVTLP